MLSRRVRSEFAFPVERGESSSRTSLSEIGALFTGVGSICVCAAMSITFAGLLVSDGSELEVDELSRVVAHAHAGQKQDTGVKKASGRSDESLVALGVFCAILSELVEDQNRQPGDSGECRLLDRQSQLTEVEDQSACEGQNLVERDRSEQQPSPAGDAEEADRQCDLLEDGERS